MQVNFPNPEQINLERAAQVGAQAEKILGGEEWKWIYEYILGALSDQAINTLKNAKTEEDRVRAQQQFLAAHRPKEILEGLISTGQAAKLSLQDISTLEGENNG